MIFVNMFIIFINGIHKPSKVCKSITYAYDTTLFSILSSAVHESNHGMHGGSTGINCAISDVN